MESTTTDNKAPAVKETQPVPNETKAKTITHEIAEAPVEAGHAVVEGVEIIGHEVAKVVVEGVTVVVDATKKAADDIAEAGKQLRREPLVASPTPAVPHPTTAPVAVVAPVVALPSEIIASAAVAPVA